MKQILHKEVLARMRQQMLLLGLAVVEGAAAGVLTAVFGHGVLAMTEVRERYPLLLALLPAAGALIWLVYSRWGEECRRGMALVFEAVAGRREQVPLRLIPLAVGSTWVGHLFGASVGREGVAVQISVAAAGLLTPRLSVPQEKRRLLISAVAAGFAGLFRTPLAASAFAMEMFHTGVMEYDALIPALAAALTASAVSGALGVNPPASGLAASAPALSVEMLIALVVLGAASGLAGWLFITLLHGLKDKLGRWVPNACLRMVLAGALAAVLGLAAAGRYNGLSETLAAAALAGGQVYPWDWLAKLCLTALCLAAGFQGGEVAPLFTVGAALGALLAGPLGMPVPLAAALGYAAVFGAGTNTLVAPVLVGLELFGGEYFGCLCLVCAVAYGCSSVHSIYPQRPLLLREEED